MRLGASIGKTGPAGVRQRARELEDAGIDILWTAELYGFDAASLMGFLAAVTERVQIGSSILPFYSRSPALLVVRGQTRRSTATASAVLASLPAPLAERSA